MRVELLTDDMELKWNSFVEENSECSVYHSLKWRDLLAETYGYKPNYLIALENDEVRGILPLMKVEGLITGKRYVSLPFSHHVPLIGSDEAKEKLVANAVEKAQQEKAKLIIKNDAYRHAPELLTQTNLNFITQLSLDEDEESLWKKADPKKARWSARKADKKGVDIINVSSVQNIEAYERMEIQTRKRQGAPPYPRGYFARLFKLLNCAVLQLAKHEDKIVAGNILIESGRKMIYAYGASLEEGMKVSANDLLIWEGIKLAKKRGLQIFDFGTTPIHHIDLLRFKEKWGGETEELAYSLYPASKTAGPKRDGTPVKLASALLRRMPKSLYLKIGPILLKEVG